MVNSIYGCLQPGVKVGVETRAIMSSGARLEMFVEEKPEYVFADDTKVSHCALLALTLTDSIP